MLAARESGRLSIRSMPVVWMERRSRPELKRGGDEKFRALQGSYIRDGGHLVICQSPQWQQYLEFGDLLPVTIQGMEHEARKLPQTAPASLFFFRTSSSRAARTRRPTAEVKLETILGKSPTAAVLHRPRGRPSPERSWMSGFRVGQGWPGPHAVCGCRRAARARSGRLGRAGSGRSRDHIPRQIGLGSTFGIAVCDWHNVGRSRWTTSTWPDRVKNPSSLARGNGRSRGQAFVHPRCSIFPADSVSALVALAVAFFILYWVIAGPGMFAYLANRHHPHLSELVCLHSLCDGGNGCDGADRQACRSMGPPQLAGASIISRRRPGPAEAPDFNSRFGLYIKQDGPQAIELKDEHLARRSLHADCDGPEERIRDRRGLRVRHLRSSIRCQCAILATEEEPANLGSSPETPPRNSRRGESGTAPQARSTGSAKPGGHPEDDRRRADQCNRPAA